MDNGAVLRRNRSHLNTTEELPTDVRLRAQSPQRIQAPPPPVAPRTPIGSCSPVQVSGKPGTDGTARLTRSGQVVRTPPRLRDFRE